MAMLGESVLLSSSTFGLVSDTILNTQAVFQRWESSSTLSGCVRFESLWVTQNAQSELLDKTYGF